MRPMVHDYMYYLMLEAFCVWSNLLDSVSFMYKHLIPEFKNFTSCMPGMMVKHSVITAL